MSDNKQKGTFLNAKDGRFEGALRLPDGTEYKGVVFPNKGQDGKTWYRGEFTATDIDTYNADAQFAQHTAKTGQKPQGISEKSTLKPLEVRLNHQTFSNGQAGYVSQIFGSKGVFTVFAHEGTNKNGNHFLRVNVALPRPQPQPTKPTGDNPSTSSQHVPEVK